MTITLISLRNALLAEGWLLNHQSRNDGKIVSCYLSRRDVRPEREIRISDHELRSKNGEPQGLKWAINVVVNPDLSLADHLAACRDEEYCNSFDGFGSGYNLDEYRAAQGE